MKNINRIPFFLYRSVAVFCVCLLLAASALAASEDDSFFGVEMPTPQPTAGEVPAGEVVDGHMRVWLQSLGVREALGLTLAGSYSVDGDRGFQFDPGTEISLGLEDGRILLRVGGATIDMGSAFTLIRHLDAQGEAGGVYIHEAETDNLYCGDVNLKAQDGSIRVIVTLPMEDYLYGVVPYEMSDTFPMEALKAQAVAARSYAMYRKTRRAQEEYDAVDTANDQVFKGLDLRYENPIRAVEETRGIVGKHQGAYAECFFTASNGGQTALPTDVWGPGDFGYFDMRDDPYDLENPLSIEKAAVVPKKDPSQIPFALFQLLNEAVLAEWNARGEPAASAEVTEILQIEAVEPVYGGESRQYGTVRFTVQANLRALVPAAEEESPTQAPLEPLEEPLVVELSFYDQVRAALEIGINNQNADMLTVEESADSFTLISRRYGHGVGMSQRGAQWMAAQHDMGYLDILAFYYPGMELAQLQWEEKELHEAQALPESLGYAAPRATPAPTPAPLPPLAEGETYATVQVEGANSTLNVRSGPSTEDEVIGTLRNGARLIVMEELPDGWARMKTAELEGYVMMSFVLRE